MVGLYDFFVKESKVIVEPVPVHISHKVDVGERDQQVLQFVGAILEKDVHSVRSLFVIFKINL